MEAIKNLIAFEWLKGYRTLAIVAVIVAGYVVEGLAGIDIPGVDFTLEMVLVALGLKTAADHSS